MIDLVSKARLWMAPVLTYLAGVVLMGLVVYFFTIWYQTQEFPGLPAVATAIAIAVMLSIQPLRRSLIRYVLYVGPSFLALFILYQIGFEWIGPVLMINYLVTKRVIKQAGQFLKT